MQQAVSSIRPFVDEIVLVWTTQELRASIDGVDKVDSFDACNAQEDCSPESTCRCKKGDLLDFSAARNRSFELASGDLLTYVDSDDVFVGSGDLRKAYREDARVIFPYEYAFNAAGECTDKHYTDRIVKKGTYWTEPVHNLLAVDTSMPAIKNDSFIWRHQRNHSGVEASRERSLRILRHWAYLPRYQNDARFVYYLGRVHLDCGFLGRASRELERAFDLETFTDKKVTIALDLARCWSMAPGDGAKYGLVWGFRALELRPEWPAPWLALARLYCKLSQDRLARKFLRCGLECDPPDTMLFVDPTDAVYTQHLILGSGRAHAA